MTKKGGSSGHFVSGAVQSAKSPSAPPDLSRLSDILLKSPEWKKNAMRDIEAMRDSTPVDADARRLKAALLELIERHWPALVSASNSTAAGSAEAEAVNDDLADPTAGELARSVQQRDAEIRRLEERIAALETENKHLSERFRSEVDSRSNELHMLRNAFSQFQEESDQLLSELDQENAYLLSDRRP